MVASSSETVSGSCHEEFESVRDAFAANFSDRDELGAAVCVTVDGETVVDLWGGVADAEGDRDWEHDTRVVVYSCTKGATALCAHVLADRGHLDLDASVGEYWPEFASNGKEAAVVSMLLDHSIGVPALTAQLQPGDMYDWDTMCDHLAKQTPWWTPGTRNGYHLITFGWLVGELVRRVDGRDLGTFFRDEVATPLELEFDIGLPEALESVVAPIVPWTPTPDYDTAFTARWPPIPPAFRDEGSGTSSRPLSTTTVASTTRPRSAGLAASPPREASPGCTDLSPWPIAANWSARTRSCAWPRRASPRPRTPCC